MSDALVDQLTTLGLCEWPTPLHISAADVGAVLSAAPYEGLVCLLGAALDRGLVRTDEASTAAVMAAWAEAMARSVQLDGLLQQVTRCLHQAGLDTRALKGAAVATLDEADPSWRAYQDVDVLVPATGLLAAVDALARAGMRPAIEPVGRRWAGRYAKSITLVHPSGMQVDVHRMLATGVFGERLRPGCLFAVGRQFIVGGVTITALADPHRLLHACYHAALGGTRGARHRRDVLLLANHVAVAEVRDLWNEGWSPTVVAAALRWAGEPAADWASWLAEHVDDPADLALLAAYGGTFGDKAGAMVRSARGPLAKLRYGWALWWPSRAHLRSRGRTRRRHMVEAVRARLVARRPKGHS